MKKVGVHEEFEQLFSGIFSRSFFQRRIILYDTVDSGIEKETERAFVIQPKPTSRKAADPPKPVQIERSSSFLIRRRAQDKVRDHGEAEYCWTFMSEHRSV